MKITTKDIISQFQTMYREHWQYEWGKHEKGVVDCSGAFTYSFQQYGLKCPNGSNAIARHYIVGAILPICQAVPGMAAFKSKAYGEEDYNLPDKYKIGGSDYDGNLNDFYHIGLVDEDPHFVLNAKGTKQGFCRDKLTSDNGWDFVAYLKNVDYGEGEQMPVELKGDWAKVVRPEGTTGNTVRMRKGHSTTADTIEKIPFGTQVMVTQDIGQWCEIQYNGETGWMMSNYLEYINQDDETDSISEVDRKRIEDALSSIQTQLDIIGAIIGRG